ncbi:DUF805 domain-containing protein [Alloscardovia macacae]|uniref:DUF805 domain-containing protein n=1 Tax=Alloscardovia macacae TaxID=1160091 RepID=A0A261F712_9BIFI|nr:DUF805 domain-containing protein [Alloscardovia macacae]OZG54922.1 hypothetical protein ALMA_0247 [Alloscardovia macacae]
MATTPYSPHFGEPPLNQPFYGAGPLQATRRYFAHYATFRGRASRSEFWWPQVVIAVLNAALILIGWLLDTATIPLALSSILSLATFIPWLSAACRRMHDTNRSGKWLLILLLGSVMAFYLAIIVAVVGILLSAGPSLISDIMFASRTNGPVPLPAIDALSPLSIVVLFAAACVATFSVICWILFVIFMTQESVDAGVRFDREVRLV